MLQEISFKYMFIEAFINALVSCLFLAMLFIVIGMLA